MSREAHIPLALWVSAAIVAHLAGGGGANEVATFVEGRRELRRLVAETRESVRANLDGGTIELALVEEPPTPPEITAPEDGAGGGALGEDDETEEAKKPKPEERRPDEAPPPPEPPEPAADAPPPPDEVPSPEAPKPETPKKDDKELVIPVVPDRRIAIKQHTQPDQEDNPDASRIADQANHTTEEEVARIRAYDGDAKDPSPGAHAGPREAIGDADAMELGFVEESPGDREHAPGEDAPDSRSATHEAPEPEISPTAERASAPEGDGGLPGAPGAAAPAAVAPEAPPPSLGGAGPASPEVVTGDLGGYSLDPANPGGDGRAAQPGRAAPPTARPSVVDVRSLGLGGAGLPGIANLSHTGVEAAVGLEQLRREREADGASRRKKHRGSFHATSFDRWRAAVENYEPSVKLGNQTNLNAAAVPFASYLNSIHNRLHPIFADEYLRSLDNRPMNASVNQRGLVTHIEIVLSAVDGRLVRLGVTKQSGVMEFDVSALKSIEQAAPFGQAPDIIASPDGNVYLHWEFHRDPFNACSTRNARPFKLKSPPTLGKAPKPRKPGLPGATPTDEGSPTPAPLLPLRKP